MYDLISRQALCEYALNQKDKSITPNDIMRFPPAQPEIVRCKDCKHRPILDEDEELHFPTYKCPCQCEDYYYSWMPKDDWFCGNGERKEK